MQQAATALVAEDAAASRGLVEDETLIEEERNIDQDINDQRRRRSESSVASQKRYDAAERSDQDDDEDDLEEAVDRKDASTTYGSGFKFADRRTSLYDLAHSSNDTKRIKKAKRKAFVRRAMVNVFFIASWYLFSTLLSVYNKWMFSPDHHNFGFPLFVTTFHMLVQFILAGLVLALFPRFRPKASLSPTDYAIKAAPCGTATGLDIGLSNLSLKTITLSFYTMCKSSTLGFVLLFAFIFKLEKPTWRLTGIISLITIGLVLMVSGETQFDFLGMMEVLTASAMGGLRWALTQKLLDKEALGLNNPFATLFFLAPVMAATLAICSLIIEGPWAIFASEEHWGGLWKTLETGVLILFPGILAFFMTTSEFALIQRTSVVTLWVPSVAGIFKEVSTIFLSTTIFHDELTPINISGLCITLVGIATYNYLRFSEAVAVNNASPQTTYTASQRDGEGDALRPHEDADVHALPLYNMADESALYPAQGNVDSEIQHTIFDEGDLSSDEDGSDSDSIKIKREHVGAEEPDLTSLQTDAELVKLDHEVDLLQKDLER